jgi:hypothetical protein
MARLFLVGHYPTVRAYQDLLEILAEAESLNASPEPELQELRSGLQVVDLPAPWEGDEGDQTAPPTPHGENLPGG